MGRSTHCTVFEWQRIKDLRASGLTYKNISEIMKCSQNIITNALKFKYTTERRGNKRKTKSNDDRRVVVATKKSPFYHPGNL